jgi:N6-L-threonylcarbamoyladenine synthase
MTRRILAIESSCDETAAAVVDEDLRALSSVVSSQIDLHAAFGGVVPEVAGRAHVELLEPVVAEALELAGGSMTEPGVAGVAVTMGPGLVGSLLVGLSGAKAMAWAWGVPLVGINHLEGHLFAAQLEAPDVPHPHVTLLVSGGHTLLLDVRAPGDYRLLGGTIDDAAGEAYDKVARYVGLGYPGGPAIDRLASSGDPTAFRFPRSMLGHGLDLSFSGLKTAVVRAVDAAGADVVVADVAASFQAAVVDVLVAKAMAAVEATGATALVLGGGVAANSALRAAASDAAAQAGIACFLPSMAMCTDNAAMIAAAGFHHLNGGGDGLDLAANPSLELDVAVAAP